MPQITADPFEGKDNGKLQAVRPGTTATTHRWPRAVWAGQLPGKPAQ